MTRMNLGHHRRRPQAGGLHLDFHHSQNPSSSTQLAHQMNPFDGLPRVQLDQQFAVGLSATSAMHPNDYSLTAAASVTQPSTMWSPSNLTQLNFDDQAITDYYQYSSAVAGNEHEGVFLRAMDFSDIPRSWTLYDPRILNESNMAVEALDPSAYMINHDSDDLQRPSDQSALGRDALPTSQFPSRFGIDRSPKMEYDTAGSNHLAVPNPNHFRLPSIEDSDCGERSSRELTATEADDHSAEEPYAKLIHRALMSVPSHAMVLQEIYQWFRENTVKGTADNKGWMNSIRHNLSMNAAFKKTERKIAGDEVKKSTEWVLEDFAIKDGVQSTTRYRKGTGTKKFVKSDNPAPARQSSGRKGGISARQTKLQRQRIRDERSDSRRGIHKYDIHQPQFLQHGLNKIVHRLNSPSTPPNHETIPSTSPYFLPKAEPLDIPYDDICRLEDAQGVYLDDGPVFTNSQDVPYHGGLPGY